MSSRPCVHDPVLHTCASYAEQEHKLANSVNSKEQEMSRRPRSQDPALHTLHSYAVNVLQHPKCDRCWSGPDCIHYTLGADQLKGLDVHMTALPATVQHHLTEPCSQVDTA